MILLRGTIRIGKIHHTGTEEHQMEMFLLTRAIKVGMIHCRGYGLETERIDIQGGEDQMIEVLQVIGTIVLTLNTLSNTKGNQLVEIMVPRSH